MDVPSLPHVKKGGPRAMSMDAPELGQTGYDDLPPVQPIQPAQAQANVMSDFADSNDDQPPVKPLETQSTFQNVAEADPDRAAKILTLSKQADQPPEFVDKNLDQMEKAKAAPGTSFFAELEKSYPGSTEFIKKPENMIVAKDDLSNVAQHEGLVQSFKNAMQSGSNALESGSLQEELAFTRYNQMMQNGQTGQPDVSIPVLGNYDFRVGRGVAERNGITSTDPEIRSQEIQKRIDELNKDRPQEFGIKKGLYGALEFLPNIAGGIGYGAKYGAPAAGAAAGLSAWAGPASMLSATAAGGAGFAAGEGEYNYKFMAGTAYDSLSKVKDADGNPLPENLKQIAAISTGVATAGLSFVKLDTVLNSIPGGKQFAAKFAAEAGEKVLSSPATMGAALKKFTSEYVQTVAHGTAAMVGISATNIAGTEAAKAISGQDFDADSAGPKADGFTPSMTVGQVAKDLWDTTKDSALTFGVMGIPGHAMQGFKDVQAASKAAQAKDFYTAIGEAAENSKLRQRMPEAYKQMIDGITKDGPVENIYMPVQAMEEYFQSKQIDPEVAMKELGVSDSYAEAKQTGGDVKVPLSNWAEKIAGTEHHAGLADNIKFNPDDLTVREVNEKRAEIQAATKEAEASAQNPTTEDATQPVTQEHIDSVRKIHDSINEQLKAAGVTPDEANISPELHAAFFKSLGDKMGVDPYELSQKYGLKVERVKAGEENAPTSVVALKPDVLKSIRSDMDSVSSNAGGYLTDEHGTINGRYGAASDAPSYFQGKGIKKAEAITALDKILAGKKLTDKQSKIVHELYSSSGYDHELQRATEEPMLQSKATKENDTRVSQTQFPKPDQVKVTEAEQLPERNPRDKAGLRNSVSNEIAGKSVTNEHTGWTIDIPKKGIKETLTHNVSDSTLETALHSLPELLENAVYDKTRTDGLSEGTKGEHWLYAPLQIGDQMHTVSLLVREQEVKGEGTHKFYLEKVSEETKPTGSRGRVSEDAADAGRSSGPRTISIDEHDAMVNSERNTRQDLFQAHGNDDGPRGRIRFGTQGSDRTFHIDLLKNADRSTFLHETGHYFLEVMHDIASKDDAHPDIKADYGAIRNWLGAKDGEKITVDQHEQFARGFESYLRDGEAPTPTLQTAFHKFRDWLVQLYKDVRSLNVSLTPEVRQVMDRMLATKNEIEDAKNQVGIKDSEIPGALPEMQNRIRTLQDRAREIAENALLKPQLEELKASRKDFLASERERLTKEAESTVRQAPLYQAIGELKATVGPKKFERIIGEFLDGTLKPHDAAAIEEMAEVHGFKDGHDLATQIKDAQDNKSFEKSVQAIVAEGMKPHADIMDSGALKDAAMKAIHTDKMTELLALEREAMAGLIHNRDIRQEVSARNRNEAALVAKAAKDQAREILSAKPITEAGKFQPYFTAERNAAVKAEKALMRGDYEKAAEFKRQQMLNHALASEALRLKSEIDRTVDRLTEMGKRGNDMKNMSYGFVRQLDNLLGRHKLAEKRTEDIATLTSIATEMKGRSEDDAEIANATGLVQDQNGRWQPESISDFGARVNDNYRPMILPESVMIERDRDYKDLNINELRDVKEAAKLINEVGKKFDRFLGQFETADIKQAAAKFRASVEEEIGSPYAEQRRIGRSADGRFKEFIKSIGSFPDSIIPNMVNMATLAKFLDGGKNDGLFHDYIYRPLKEAEDRKFGRYEKMRTEVEKLFSDHYTPKELSSYKERSSEQFFPEIGRSLTREEVLSLALNSGNEGNLDRIRKGYGLEDWQIKRITDSLGKKDWDFVQAAWDHLDKYWPEISALEMRVNGVEAGRVEPKAFKNEHGEYRGGYYPIKYDFEKSSEAYQTEEQKNETYKQFSAAAAHTDRGHAKERVSNVSRPVRLSLDVLFGHLENVVHDLEFREPIIDVNRFLKQNDVRTALENAIGVKPAASVTEWLKAQGSEQGNVLSFAEKAYQWTRFSTTLSTLGFSPKALFLHFPGNIMNAMWEIGGTRTYNMLSNSFMEHAAGRGSEMKDFVFSKSERMNQRLTIRDRDIMDMSKKWQGTAAGLIPHFAFMGLHFADEAVSIPLWSEIYKANVGEHGDEKAIQLADEAVTRTLGSGSMVDRIGDQRGGGAKKLFSMFYSWMSVMFNRAWLDGKIAGLEYNKGNTGQAIGIMAKAAVYAWLLPAAHEAMLAEYMRNAPKGTDDDRNKRIAAKMIEHPFGMMLFARDVAPYVVETALGEKGQNHLSMSPVAGALENILKPAGESAHLAFSHGAHADEKYIETVAKGAAQVTGTPQQLNTWMFNLYDYSQNKGPATWQDFLSRRRKK